MYIGIIGAGAVGAPLARKFSQLGEKVVVIDKNEERCKQIAMSADAQIFLGDGRDTQILEMAGIKDVDFLLVLTDDDDANAEISKVAKNMFGVPNVVALANSPSKKVLLNDSGADKVICPEEQVIELFEKVVFKKSVETIFNDEASKLKVLRVTVGPESLAIGKTVSELRLLRGCTLLLITRNNHYIYPGKGVRNIQIQMGDLIYLFGASDEVDSAAVLYNFNEASLT
jgi:trk system potassium uptake protein TrkA